MKELIIRHILGWLIGLTSAQWKAALEFVIKAAQIKGGGEDKKRFFVLEFVSKFAKALNESNIDLVRKLAFRYATKKGLIP